MCCGALQVEMALLRVKRSFNSEHIVSGLEFSLYSMTVGTIDMIDVVWNEDIYTNL
jgi:hypothetical protein